MKNLFKLIGIIALAAVIGFAACDDGSGDPNNSNNNNGDGDTVISIAAIAGVTAPVQGATPVTAITANAQYTGTVAWNGTPATFAYATAYTATITLTAKSGYTLQGVTANFFTVAGATSVSNAANSGVITAVFPQTADDSSLSTLTGTITISPNNGVTVNTELTATYSGSETVTYQWKKDGGNVGTASTTNPNKYTPTEAGAYTVTVSLAGYNSKTSDPVTVTVPATPVTFSSVSANGSATATTTTLTLTFSAAITGLSANDIALSGVANVQKGTLSGSGPTYTLGISGFTAGGSLSVAVSKTGYNISGSPKTATIYYYSGSSNTPVTFSSVTANGSATATTTTLTLTFSAAITGLSANDISLSNVANVQKGTLSGSGPTYTLGISGFTAGGSLSVAVSKTGYNISGSPKTVTIYYYNNVPATPATPQPFNDITAVQLVANIKIGWNLGNTLDAAHLTWLPANPTVTQMETGWGSPVTTKAMITAIKNAGFNTIRIPVSWTKAAGGAPNYTIRSDWMVRVVEIVNYAVENDMYIILNTHHDEDVFGFLNSNAAAGKAAFQKIWEQIADTFKNYDEKLIFEGLNEPRTEGSANEWSGGTPEERNNLNAYYPIFVNAVRNSGGNNNRRILQINTYAASVEQSAIDGLTLPTDTVANKLVVSVHAYQPYPFCYIPDVGNQTTWSSSNPSDVAGVTGPIDRVYNKFVSNGIPVIIGEFYAMDKNNEAARAAWAEYYVDYAWKKGIKCVLWDNATFGGDSEQFGFYNRTANTFPFPQILTGLMNGTTGTPPTPGGKTINVNPNVYDAGDGQGSVAHGYQAKVSISELTGSSIQVTSGDTFTFTYTFTSDVAIGNLQVVLVDTRPDAPTPYYTELSGYVDIGAVTVGTSVSDTKTITATATAGDSSNDANQFVFNIGETSGAASAPTLTFTALTLVKN